MINITSVLYMYYVFFCVSVFSVIVSILCKRPRFDLIKLILSIDLSYFLCVNVSRVLRPSDISFIKGEYTMWRGGGTSSPVLVEL